MPTANQNWRIDNAGRLLGRYRDNDRLNKCWQAAFDAGIPEEERQPWGASNPLADVPTDGLFSEHILRAFEAYRGRGAEEYPVRSFKPDLKAIARNLETACRIAVEGYGVASVAIDLIPLGWLTTAAEFQWYRSAPGVSDPREAITKDFRAEDGPYPYLGALWDAWGLAPRLPLGHGRINGKACRVACPRGPGAASPWASSSEARNPLGLTGIGIRQRHVKAYGMSPQVIESASVGIAADP